MQPEQSTTETAEDTPRTKLIPEKEPGWRWLKEPAIYCDAYTVDVFSDANIVRLSFGEYISEDVLPFYRVGIAMPLTDVKKLIHSLNKVIERYEKDGATGGVEQK
jgi:hypothetical protein